MIEPGDPPELAELLEAALELPDVATRLRWLEWLGPELDMLKPRLLQLLQAHDASLPAGEGGAGDGAAWVQPPEPPAKKGVTLALFSDLVDQVGPYRLLEEIGRGGMAEVWLAENQTTGQRVALKLPAVSRNSAAFQARLERERDLLQRLVHPGIARLLDAGVSPLGQHYLALEYVEGLPLDVYGDTARLAVDRRLELMLQVMQAVEYAHSRSVLHRDLKPSNVLVTAEGEVRLLDFGISKLLVDGQAESTELTEVYGRMLTPDYASPEQFAGGVVTVRSDVYSLGVMLYEQISGSRPYSTVDATGHPALATGAQRALLPPSQGCRADAAVTLCAGGVSALKRRLTGDIDAIVMRALREDPAERYASVAAMAADLSLVLAGRRIGTPLQRWRARAQLAWRQHRGAITVSALLAVAVVLADSTHQLAADLETLVTPPLPPAKRVALVTIGPGDRQRLFGESSPLDQLPLARLVERILAGQPAVLGVDIDTSGPAASALRQLLPAAMLARVVWGRDIDASSDAGLLPVPRPVLGGGEPVRSGLAVSLAEGASGRVRWFRREVATAAGPLPSLAGEVARGLLPAPSTDAQAGVLRGIRFTGGERLELPASVVLADGFDWGSRIAGRVVLLGGRYDSADVHPTPLGLMHGIDILAFSIESQLAGRDHPRPGLLAMLAVALCQLALVSGLLAFWPLRWVVPAGIATAGVLTALGAASGWFPAWSYALLIGLAAVAGPLLWQGWLLLAGPLRRNSGFFRRRLGRVDGR